MKGYLPGKTLAPTKKVVVVATLGTLLVALLLHSLYSLTQWSSYLRLQTVVQEQLNTGQSTYIIFDLVETKLLALEHNRGVQTLVHVIGLVESNQLEAARLRLRHLSGLPPDVQNHATIIVSRANPAESSTIAQCSQELRDLLKSLIESLSRPNVSPLIVGLYDYWHST